MYVGYNKIYCVSGSVYGRTLAFEVNKELKKFTTKQTFQKTLTGFIQFIREANGECDILHIVEAPLMEQ